MANLIISILAASMFNTASPAVQAECAHAEMNVEMVSCVTHAEARISPFVACTNDSDCSEKNGGQY